MESAVRQALPRVLSRLEMFSDATVCTGESCVVVQVMERWWIYEDGTAVKTIHRADKPMVGIIEEVTSPQRVCQLRRNLAVLTKLAAVL